ncbi:hypothetical protein GC169_12370 [bacterium]|nr:hypothetical protein [bacterium]
MRYVWIAALGLGSGICVSPIAAGQTVQPVEIVPADQQTVACGPLAAAIYFPTDIDALSPEAEAVLARLGAAVSSCAVRRVELATEFDPARDDGGLARALARVHLVAQTLIAPGGDQTGIVLDVRPATGFGGPQSRRVDIRVSPARGAEGQDDAAQDARGAARAAPRAKRPRSVAL